MTIIDRMFKFPVRIYDPVNDMENIPSSPLKWVRGWRRIFPEDITDVGDTFYSDEDIDEVIARGYFVCSKIGTPDITYICDWPRDILEKKLIEHIRRVEEYDNPSKKKKKSPSISAPGVKTSHNIALD